MRTKIARHALLVIATLLSTVAVATLGAVGAEAQGTCNLPAQYQGSATFAASSASAVPGSTIVFTGSGWPANSSIPVTVDGVSVGSATTNAGGNFSFSYTFPGTTTNGTHVVSASCGAFVLSQNISVSSGSVTPTITTVTPLTTTTSSLPVTGSNSIGIAQVALALLAAGGLLVLITRRRAHANS